MMQDTKILSSRSRRQNSLRCMRARYWLDEAFGTGFSPKRVAVPLATGGAVHKGLASLLLDENWKNFPAAATQCAVDKAIEAFKSECAGRDLDLENLENQSFVYNEQLALTEALVRLAAFRAVPKLLEIYEVLEVERLDVASLVNQDNTHVDWRSIPDALLRHKDSGELYLLSWKTTSEYSMQKDQDARVDMQGLSEAWTWEQARLQVWRETVEEVGRGQTRPKTPMNAASAASAVSAVSQMLWDRAEAGEDFPEIRGIQMVYLVKGQRRKNDEGTKVTKSDLLGGYRQVIEGVTDPISGTVEAGRVQFATDLYYQCPEPHPFRWAKGGTCPGQKTHKRSGDWEKFHAWETEGGVAAWLELLAKGGTGDPDVLDRQWAMPVPWYRTREAMKRWETQTRTEEARLAQNLELTRVYEETLREDVMNQYVVEAWLEDLDHRWPQATEKCADWFHRRCPAFDLCHGPEHIRLDPAGSGLYQIKPQYEQKETEVSV